MLWVAAVSGDIILLYLLDYGGAGYSASAFLNPEE